ncbi:MAG: acetyl-CoA acetyltransferase [Ilumatobacter sp.]|uniref:acetyl-CoA acetyltransferase n=1 Tax=Ilumatobacter sp. TaxID=1967498 RepID=UPI003297FD08
MMINPRTPVLVAVGELTNRSDAIVDPIDLAAEAVRLAFADAVAPVADRIDTVASPGTLLMRRDNPAHRIAEAVGLRPGRRISCPVGGNTPQYLVGQLGAEIMARTCDVALIVGAEAGQSARRTRRTGDLPPADPIDGVDTALGDDRPGLSPAENAAGLHFPHQVYPLFESAMAARAGHTLDEHRVWLGRLMAPFTAEAARHPDQAWFPAERTPSELSDVTPENRLINEPYTKLLNSILTVDMAAAFVLMAAEVAEELGIPRDRWVFSWATATCNDVYFPVQRPDLASSAGIRAAGTAVLEASGIGIDDVRWFDFYSCFPAAVEAAIDAFELDPFDERGFTVTGGLPYHGGPGNNYVSHSIVEMARRCRAEPDAIGMISGLGWYITKHSLGIWSGTPPPNRWVDSDMTEQQAAIDATALDVVDASDATGTATIDAYTVMHDREEGPTSVPVFARTADGRRVVARSDDRAVARAMSGGMFVGQTIDLKPADDHARFETEFELK